MPSYFLLTEFSHLSCVFPELSNDQPPFPIFFSIQVITGKLKSLISLPYKVNTQVLAFVSDTAHFFFIYIPFPLAHGTLQPDLWLPTPALIAWGIIWPPKFVWPMGVALGSAQRLMPALLPTQYPLRNNWICINTHVLSPLVSWSGWVYILVLYWFPDFPSKIRLYLSTVVEMLERKVTSCPVLLLYSPPSIS